MFVRLLIYINNVRARLLMYVNKFPHATRMALKVRMLNARRSILFGGCLLESNAHIVGKTLEEVEPALFAETVENVLRRISASGAPLTDEEARIVAQRLSVARVRSRCQCGQEDCRSYYFEVPEKAQGALRFATVRFDVSGEHMLQIDNDGDIYKVERLDDLQGAEP